MNKSRRSFLRDFTLVTGSLVAVSELIAEPKFLHDTQNSFNMWSFKADKINKVRIAVVGLGMRGSDAVGRLLYIDGVEITCLCDLVAERVEKSQVTLRKRGLKEAKGYHGSEGWKTMIKENDIDLVYICTPWAFHAEMAIESMNAGKHVACEVPLALTVEECWEVVRTSEKTKKHCMMLENTCYDFFEMLTLNMSRQGLFGELIHAEGAYIHDLIDLNFSKEGYYDMWRLRENIKHNGNLYPTHGLGPISQCLNINCGDRFDYLVSMQSNDFSMGQTAKRLSEKDSFYTEFADNKFRGNMNMTMIKSISGKTVMVQHDVSSPRPYSRLHVLSGTKGFAQKYPDEKISFGHEFINKQELDILYEKYLPKLSKEIGELAKKIGGHGGIDFMMDWRLIDCLRNGLPIDQPVYEGALWSSIIPLSEKSIKRGSQPIKVPDFTKGSWKENAPFDLEMKGGGNTKVLLKK